MDNHKDICRSFSFVNFNIPPRMKNFSDEKDLFRCNYISIGFFDGMKTELLRPFKNRSILSSMWLYNAQLALALDGTHSFQNIFGFRHVADEQEDIDFWSYDVDCRYPLTFVTFLQMQPEADVRSTINKQLQIIESKLANEVRNSGDNFIFSCYVTLDKNDFVICIKSRQYRGIANSILALHNELRPKILYSYSVLSLNRRWMNDLAENEALFPVDGTQDELIDSICLKGITNSVTSGSLADKYRELCLHLDRFLFVDWARNEHDSYLYDILGDYDFRYIARKVPMKRLLLAIAKKDGPLNYESLLFRFALFSSSFVLNIQSGGVQTGGSNHCDSTALSDNILRNVSGYTSVLKEDKLSDGVKMLDARLVSPLCGKLMDKLADYRRKLTEDLNKPDSFSLEHTSYWANMVSLWKMLSSLAALEKAPTRKYDFHSLYWPYRMLIEILDNENYYDSRKLSDGDLYGFIHGLSSTLHGTLRTDIQFFQINDFNAIVHYAPAKLRAFYSAWTYELAQCYRRIHVMSPDDLEREYEFAIVPNTNSAIRTFGFDSSLKEPYMPGNKRLMRIEIPERYLYQPRETCIHLAHETAHFVGTGVRRRSFRHKQFIKILSAMMAIQYCTDICNCLVECGRTKSAELFKNFIGFVQNELCGDLRTLLEKAVTDVSKADGINDIWENEHIKSNQFTSYASTALQSVLSDSVYDIGQFEDGVGSACSHVASRIRYLCAEFRFYARDKWDGDPEELEASLVDLVRISDDISSSQYSVNFAMYLQQAEPVGILQMIMHLIKEVHADITSILTLRITPPQYLRSFFRSGLTFEGEHLGMILKFRLFLVLSALQEASERDDLRFLKGKGWNKPFSKSGEDADTPIDAGNWDIQWVESVLKAVDKQITLSLFANTAILPIRDVNGKQGEARTVRNATHGFFVLYSRYIAEKILDYLRECVSSIAPEFNVDKSKMNPGLKQLPETYSKICSKDVMELVEEIDKTLFTYEKKRSRQKIDAESDL